MGDTHRGVVVRVLIVELTLAVGVAVTVGEVVLWRSCSFGVFFDCGVEPGEYVQIGVVLDVVVGDVSAFGSQGGPVVVRFAFVVGRYLVVFGQCKPVEVDVVVEVLE